MTETVPTGGKDRRRDRRWVINETVELTVGDGSAGYRIIDISATGARVLTDVDLEPNMWVLLELPGRMMIPATVIHKLPDSIGVQFEVGPAARDRLLDWIEATAELTTKANGETRGAAEPPSGES